MLHLIFQASADSVLLDRMATGDVAVFLESGVFNVLKTGKLADLLANKLTTHSIYVLSEDMVIRGIEETQLVKGLKTIDYSALVNLTIENPLNASWC
jgi:tRNA 2-thiouridine synthesizing protein B